MLYRLAEISTPKHVATCQVYGEEYKIYRLIFDDDESNFFVFRPMNKHGIEKIIDLDTGNALFPNNKGTSYMVFATDFRIVAPFIYKIFIYDDKQKLKFNEEYVDFEDYSANKSFCYDFEIDGNILSYGMGPTKNDVLFIKLKRQSKRLVYSLQNTWRLDEKTVLT